MAPRTNLQAVHRVVMHVDMDAFFAAVEQLDRPDLRGKPVIVGADPAKGRGVVSTASYEARKFGVHSAMPISQAVRSCPNGVFLRPRFDRYSELSDKIFDILREYSPSVEPLSIDEAFVDLTGTERLKGAPEFVGREVKCRILEETGLIASVGIAPNMFLAKLASDFGKPDGFILIKPEEVRNFLHPLPVSRIWGVGPTTEKELKNIGIETVGRLADFETTSLQRLLGDYGLHLQRLARGEDERQFGEHSGRGGVSIERTFLVDVSDNDEKIATFRYLADKLAVRLRKAGFWGRTITVKIRNESFKTITRSATLPSPLKNAEEIYSTALELASPELSGKIRLLGIRMSNPENAGVVQLDLFSQPTNDKIERLEKALDSINLKFGDGSISRAKTMNRKKPKG